MSGRYTWEEGDIEIVKKQRGVGDAQPLLLPRKPTDEDAEPKADDPTDTNK